MNYQKIGGIFNLTFHQRRHEDGQEKHRRCSISVITQFSSVQSCPTLCDPMNGNTPGLPVHHQLLEPTQTHVQRVGDVIQPSNPLSSPSPPAPYPSQHQGLSPRVNSSHEVAKYWSFIFNISPSNEHPRLISFRMDWLDLLAVQGTLKSLIQHHSSKASILRCSAFFTVQHSHPYMTTGKANYYRYVNQNYNEISPHTIQDSHR